MSEPERTRIARELHEARLQLRDAEEAVRQTTDLINRLEDEWWNAPDEGTNRGARK